MTMTWVLLTLGDRPKDRWRRPSVDARMAASSAYFTLLYCWPPMTIPSSNGSNACRISISSLLHTLTGIGPVWRTPRFNFRGPVLPANVLTYSVSFWERSSMHSTRYCDIPIDDRVLQISLKSTQSNVLLWSTKHASICSWTQLFKSPLNKPKRNAQMKGWLRLGKN